jgi:hypothetical protein
MSDSKFILFTNLEFVIYHKVRMNVHALLLEETPSMFSRGAKDTKVRGFGVDPAWVVFDMPIPSLDYTLTDAQGGPLFVTDSKPYGRPLFNGAIMQIGGENGVRLDLVFQDYEQQLNVQTFEGNREDRIVLKVWDVLPGLCARFWKAPAMPRLVHAPTPGFKGYGR